MEGVDRSTPVDQDFFPKGRLKDKGPEKLEQKMSGVQF